MNQRRDGYIRDNNLKCFKCSQSYKLRGRYGGHTTHDYNRVEKLFGRCNSVSRWRAAFRYAGYGENIWIDDLCPKCLFRTIKNYLVATDSDKKKGRPKGKAPVRSQQYRSEYKRQWRLGRLSKMPDWEKDQYARINYGAYSGVWGKWRQLKKEVKQYGLG